MQIANPIYDTVFKYFMNDSKIAKLFLSTIIGENIVELDFQPKDTLYKKRRKQQAAKAVELGFYYLDFNAKIETESGKYKTVLIELQKDKRVTDVVRFRQYLGSMYQSAENTYDKNRIKARQIYCIYFLNYEVISRDWPVLKIDYKITNHFTDELFHGKSEFIEGLFHVGWIVQVQHINWLNGLKSLEYLTEEHRKDFADLLSLFDQENKINPHILEIDEKALSEKYRPLIRKLHEASASEEVRKQMQAEDNYETEIKVQSKMLEEANEIIAKKEEELALEKEKAAKKDEELALEKEKAAKLAEESAAKDEIIARLLENKKETTNN